ncbi:helix-turn-helix domain-containing protein [Sediminibacterium roseum]|uniref:Helix-turn-helix domain-containing protein n=1 Tax=Sediminibacterium roseum TaxID=1978412 RepID=A0ABW9ZXS7_9BACT|nr:helix-turn-helix domain-containing protein [Sediminibacterium roseum]NCI51978.1 helix-turn-helix domain-containing protein [Sediminibacterium roseum]
MKKLIGTRIRKLRESKDLTQENIASELDITAGAYAKIERGETDPSITRIKQIADILKVDVTFFFQEQPAGLSLVAEPESNKYSTYASREDVENLAQLIRQINTKLEKLESQIENKNTGSGR